MISCEFLDLFKSTYFVEHLRTAGSEIPVGGSLFNKAESLRVWRPLIVLERASSTGIYRWILWNF